MLSKYRFPMSFEFLLFVTFKIPLSFTTISSSLPLFSSFRTLQWYNTISLLFFYHFFLAFKQTNGTFYTFIPSLILYESLFCPTYHFILRFLPSPSSLSLLSMVKVKPYSKSLPFNSTYPHFQW